MSGPARKRRVTPSLKGLQYATCPVSGKRGYRSKRDARSARSRHPQDGLHIYRCPDCRMLHLGHLPLLVSTGVVTRGDYYEQLRERAR